MRIFDGVRALFGLRRNVALSGATPRDLPRLLETRAGEKLLNDLAESSADEMLETRRALAKELADSIDGRRARNEKRSARSAMLLDRRKALEDELDRVRLAISADELGDHCAGVRERDHERALRKELHATAPAVLGDVAQAMRARHEALREDAARLGAKRNPAERARARDGLSAYSRAMSEVDELCTLALSSQELAARLDVLGRRAQAAAEDVVGEDVFQRSGAQTAAGR